ncbi:MAG TPA: alpha/beta hydrolase [Methylomirabilota bacterium]|jgi:acetyl esterase/lipase|nr:alpha/beta hydrolase [Methylomirabilota bacterium]
MSVRFDQSAPYEVEESDVSFARVDGQELLARVYRPLGEAAAPLAALVDVHGGAWSRGDRTVGVHHGRGLAACGLVVVSLDFRQGPDHKHPAAAQDISAGVRWVRANATGLGVDPPRIGISGHSSGGQLALLVAVQPGRSEHAGTPIVMSDGSLGATAGDDAVAFALALYPVADPLARYRYAVGRKNDPTFEGAARLAASSLGYFSDEVAMAGASVTGIVEGGRARALPPVWLAHPEMDDNVPATITDAFVRAYEKAGGRIERVHFPGAKHGFIGQASADTTKCIADMREFIARQLH